MVRYGNCRELTLGLQAVLPALKVGQEGVPLATPELALELMDYCRERLSHIKCPRSVDFLEALPRHPTGKLYKRLLREPYWEGRSRKI